MQIPLVSARDFDQPPIGNNFGTCALTKAPHAVESDRTAKPARRASRVAWRRLVPLFLGAVMVVLLGALVRVADPLALVQMRHLVFDTFQTWHPRDFDPDLPVRIVAIDEPSLERAGQWPWPRLRLAQLVEQLTQLGAAAIAIDFVFSEPDRLTAAELAELVPPGPDRVALRHALDRLPDGDAAFARALGAAPSVLGVVLSADGVLPNGMPPEKAGFAFAGDPPQAFVPTFDGVVAPLPDLGAMAHGLGALNWVPGRDQVVREVPLVFNLRDRGLMPSLAAEALRVAQGATTYKLRSSNASGQGAFGQASGVNAVKIGGAVVPTTADGSVLLHYSPANPQRHIPAWQVLEGVAPVDQIAGRIILIGATAPGLFDLQATPIDPAITGIEINAQLIEHILTGSYLTRPDWAAGAEFLLFAALVLLFALLAALLSPWLSVALGTATLAAVFAGSYALFARQGLFLDPGFAILGSALSLFAATSWLAIRERADRRWVRSAFQRYVPDELVDQIVQDPEALALGGELREMTILFSDIRSFTTRAEGMDAQELTSYINAFLTDLTQVIFQQDGTIDKYMGDAIMAFWNAPLTNDRHAPAACQAALDMLRALEGFNATHAGTYPPTDIGIGLNTGVCCVGNLGSTQRLDYSVIGDEVNVGARLESSTKTYGLSILVGAETAAQARSHGFVFVPVDYVRVKGKDDRIDILTLLGGPGHPVPEVVQAAIAPVSDMVAAYKSEDWEAVAQALTRARACNAPPFDTLLALYTQRLEESRDSASVDASRP